MCVYGGIIIGTIVLNAFSCINILSGVISYYQPPIHLAKKMTNESKSCFNMHTAWNVVRKYKYVHN